MTGSDIRIPFALSSSMVARGFSQLAQTVRLDHYAQCPVYSESHRERATRTDWPIDEPILLPGLPHRRQGHRRVFGRALKELFSTHLRGFCGALHRKHSLLVPMNGRSHGQLADHLVRSPTQSSEQAVGHGDLDGGHSQNLPRKSKLDATGQTRRKSVALRGHSERQHFRRFSMLPPPSRHAQRARSAAARMPLEEVGRPRRSPAEGVETAKPVC